MNRLHWIVAAAVLLPFGLLLAPVLVGSSSFVFRDSAHYYHPLFQWTDAQWSSSWPPLWNPQENCGAPLLADSTASVLYPGKLIFALPWLDFATRYNWYVSLHLLLAAAGAFLLARRVGTSILAAGLAGVSYAFGGNVLFQYCNVVYLVGAAWLPIALWASHRMLVDRQLGWAVIFGTTLAMMVLGGDPQSAYHSVLLSLLLMLLLWRKRRRGDAESSVAAPPRLAQHSTVMLAVGVAVGLLLSAVQVLPSMQWASRTDRAVFEAPRSIYEIPTVAARGRSSQQSKTWQLTGRGLFGEPQPGTHQHHIYDFSVAPWRAAECVWPNISGRTFPTNQRWTSVLPTEGRVWTPSLYMGLIPLLLALLSWRLRGASVTDRWLSWSVLVACLASLGWYSLGWLMHEVRCGLLGAAPDDILVGYPVGGVYWLMVVSLPGYAFFRFPAKLLVIAALGLSILAARGADARLSGSSSRLPLLWVCLASVSLAGAAVFWVVSQYGWQQWLSAAPASDYFGPLDAAGARRDILRSLMHTALLCLIMLGIWRVTSAGRLRHYRPLLVLMVTAADLSIAQHWMIATADAKIWREKTAMAGAISQSQKEGPPMRVYRGSMERWVPSAWTQTASADRLQEGLRWDRATVFPKYQLQQDLSLVEAYGSMTSYDFLAFMRAAKQRGPVRGDRMGEPYAPVLDALSASHLILPDNVRYPDLQRVKLPSGSNPPQDAVLWQNPRALPRAWIVRQVEAVEPLKDNAPSAVKQRTLEVLFPGGDSRDLRSSAVVESAASGLAMQQASQHQGVASDSCSIVLDEPQRVELEVELDQAGLLVLNDSYDPGWRAEVIAAGKTEAVEVLRTNRIMRGVKLEAGKYRVVFRYRPRSVLVGSLVSGASWLLLLLGGALLIWKRWSK